MRNSKLVKRKFKIEGMHCVSCAMCIDMDLENLEGMKVSNTSYAKQILEVEFDPEKVTEDVVVETVKKSGYAASPLDTNH